MIDHLDLTSPETNGYLFLFYPPNPAIFVYVERSVRFAVDMQTTVTTSQNLCVAW
jgi:hypothetical protein